MQGFNMGRYVPPDQEGILSGNQIHGKNALGNRANKISQGILTVRFEMPYPIWCTSCPKPTIIGQGVRFNAEKKKIGNYYTSPIYSFRMKHVACGGWIEIQTDPKNTAYVVIEGARKRNLGEDKVEEGDIKLITPEERETMRNNAFAALEGKVEDKNKLAQTSKRLEELFELSEKQWEDPYEKNQRLRSSFREGRNQREKEDTIRRTLQDKMSFGLEIASENELDVRRAGLIEFGTISREVALKRVITKPLFTNNNKIPHTISELSSSKCRTKAEEATRKKKAAIAAEIRNNTRAAIDPFQPGHRTDTSLRPKIMTGVKRKCTSATENNPRAGLVLVDYDSD
ncbi:unnamed protein product [Blumeria hordei]|uniref:Uncharacterized protein n=1 Tax=Blumeria hordei TaxID=2867405 RepID=A0A383UYY0_BLUHO|nr:unnamed protein product [Blumeria hordei]